MKKIVLVLVMFLFFPLVVEAASYKITNQYIRAEIQNNGDLKISELIIMDGTFNGYEKTLSYKNELLKGMDNDYESNDIYNARGLELLDIRGGYVKSVSESLFDNNSFLKFSLVDDALKGDKGVYTSSYIDNGYVYSLYYKAQREKVAFLITYMIDRAVVLHNDIAELYWNFITPNDYDDIRDVRVQVLLPGVDKSDNFRLWAHGDLSGKVKKKASNNGVDAVIKHMDKSDVLDIRLTFDKGLITDTSKVKKNSDVALKKILEVEKKRADEANIARKQAEFNKRLNLGGISVVLILFLFVYILFNKNPKSGYKEKYNREFIEDYNVEVIDYLMNKKITPNAMSAAILNLIYKKNISVQKIDDKNEYEFTLKNKDNISASDEILIDFLFNRVGSLKYNDKKEAVFTTNDLKRYARSTKTCNKFMASYTKWKKKVIDLAKKENFFEYQYLPKVLGILVLIFCFAIFFYSYKGMIQIFPLSALLVSFVLALYGIFQNKSETFAVGFLFSIILFFLFMVFNLREEHANLITLFLIITFFMVPLALSIFYVFAKKVFDIDKYMFGLMELSMIVHTILILFLSYDNMLFSSLLIIFGGLFFIYTLNLSKRSLKGAEHYDKWMAFKRFLEDFGTFQLKELPEVVLWERYLVYATVMGIAETVKKDMNVVIKEIELSDIDVTTYGNLDSVLSMSDKVRSNFVSAVNIAEVTKRSISSSSSGGGSSSSGSGGGGGFSSGGGHGGGGSSGHGF